MFNFFKNRQQKKEEQEKARQQRFQDLMNRLRIQDITIEKQKQELISRVKAAQANGLSVQANKGRQLLANCLAMEKRIKGMIMDLEFSVQSRDLAELTKSFLVCLKDIGEDIRKEVAQTDTKAEKEYEKAMYALERQTKILDSALQTTDISMSERFADAAYSKEIEEELDALVGKKQSTLSNTQREFDEI